MKTPKEFDCLKMKDEIQARLQKEWEGLTFEEVQARIREDLETSHEPIAVWWRRITENMIEKQNTQPLRG